MLKGFLIEEKKHSSRVSLRHRSTNSDRQSAAGRKTTVGNEGCFPLRCHPTGSRWLSRGCGNSVMDLIQGQKAKRRARGNAQDRRPSPPSRSGPCPLPPAGGSRGPRRPGAARPTGRFSGSSRFRREGGGGRRHLSEEGEGSFHGTAALPGSAGQPAAASERETGSLRPPLRSAAGSWGSPPHTPRDHPRQPAALTELAPEGGFKAGAG